jgi:hypothetical protein
VSRSDSLDSSAASEVATVVAPHPPLDENTVIASPTEAPGLPRSRSCSTRSRQTGSMSSFTHAFGMK